MSELVEAPSLTIEQLAQRVGMSVRNIRNHQSSGLLPPPEVRARTGYYGAEHVERLQLIQDMQGEGFNLKAIKRLVESSADGHGLLQVKRAAATPFDAEAPQILESGELDDMFGGGDERAREQALKLGLLVALDDGRFEVPSPSLLRAAEAATAAGITLIGALKAIGKVQRSCEHAARAFVEVFLDDLWKPFQAEDEDRSPEAWQQVTAALEGLRPLASEATLAVFKQTMDTEVERAVTKELARRANG